MSTPPPPSNPTQESLGNILPESLPTPRHLDPAAALAFRTPLHEHVLSADGKAAGIITLLGMMFTVLARFGPQVASLVQGPGVLRFVAAPLVIGFAVLSLLAVVQAFRTISPRFPKAPPSLAFFGDIARLSREQYVQRVESLSAPQALEQMLSYNHTGSLICVEKQRQLGRGLRCFEAAAACWAVLALVLVLRAFLPW
jgi:pycsar effector protein